jgi:large subunit ribosomal protein L13
LAELIEKDPSKALWFAVRGMLPKNKLRDPRMKRLKLVVETTTQYDNFKPVNLYK